MFLCLHSHTGEGDVRASLTSFDSDVASCNGLRRQQKARRTGEQAISKRQTVDGQDEQGGPHRTPEQAGGPASRADTASRLSFFWQVAVPASMHTRLIACRERR